MKNTTIPKPKRFELTSHDSPYVNSYPREMNSIEENLWRTDWKRNGYPYCGVYVISTDSLIPCKIGISVNPIKRLMSLQTAHWRPLQISGYRWCAHQSDALKVEQKAHMILREDGKELLGEWFDIRPSQAVDVIEWASKMIEVEVRSDCPDELTQKAMGYIMSLITSKDNQDRYASNYSGQKFKNWHNLD